MYRFTKDGQTDTVLILDELPVIMNQTILVDARCLFSQSMKVKPTSPWLSHLVNL